MNGKQEKLKELMYHELFHCLLKKGHLPEGYQGIMSPLLYPYNTYCEQESVVDCMETYYKSGILNDECKTPIVKNCFKSMRVIGYNYMKKDTKWNILVNELFSKENMDLVPTIDN